MATKTQYEAWIICDCDYIGDGWWEEYIADNGKYAYTYFCPGCRKTKIGDNESNIRSEDVTGRGSNSDTLSARDRGAITAIHRQKEYDKRINGLSE